MYPVLTREDICSAAAEDACLENPLNTQMIWMAPVINPIRLAPPASVLHALGMGLNTGEIHTGLGYHYQAIVNIILVQPHYIPVHPVIHISNICRRISSQRIELQAVLHDWPAPLLQQQESVYSGSPHLRRQKMGQKSLSKPALNGWRGTLTSRQHPRLILIGYYIMQLVGRQLN